MQRLPILRASYYPANASACRKTLGQSRKLRRSYPNRVERNIYTAYFLDERIEMILNGLWIEGSMRTASAAPPVTDISSANA